MTEETKVKMTLVYIVLVLFGFFPVPVAAGGDKAAPAQPAGKPAVSAGTAVKAEKFGYIGSKRCSMCHKGEPKGAQFEKWQASKHAKAYEVLKGDQAKAIAAEKKLAKPPFEAPECLKCHATAFAIIDKLTPGKGIALEEGVSCESCHGPGSEYWKKTTMEAIAAGTTDGKTVGLIHPTAAVCQRCHNQESPTFKDFKFAEMAAKIAHPRKAAP